jgi:hypothetical protein
MSEFSERIEQLKRWAAVNFNTPSNRRAELQGLVGPLYDKLDIIMRQNENLMRQVLTPPEHFWRGTPEHTPLAAPAPMVFDKGVLCRAHMFREPYFSFWVQELDEILRYHRKLWEFVFVCQALYERGALVEGARGLGFGVGTEPLSAYFASRGCTVVGTDMGLEEAMAAGWTDSPQHAASLAQMARPKIIPMDEFQKRVSFRVVDMNHVPEDLTDFDFCWSACAFEHLGSLEHGMAFVERSIQTLKVGGYAVHTSEYNLTSNDDTVTHGPTVYYRRRDYEDLARRVTEAGHEITPFDFHPGYGHVDRHIDVPPFGEYLHLKQQLAGWAVTSIGFVIRRLH